MSAYLPACVPACSPCPAHQGLEAQLLATVVKAERPDLDKQKNDLVVKVAAGKRTQARQCTRGGRSNEGCRNTCLME